MSNVTAAGPPRGLLDEIFGSNPVPQETEADGKSFGSLMELIGALNKRAEKEGKAAGQSWTPGETMLVKSVADGDVAETPSMKQPAATPEPAPDPQQKSQLERWSMLGIPAVMLMVPPGQAQAVPTETISAQEVNLTLRAKGLPALSTEETKLLRDVNVRLAKAESQVGEGAGIIPPALPEKASAGASLALVPKLPQAAEAGPFLDPQLQKALGMKGMDLRKLKPTEVSVAGAPETMVPTETYLQMHGNAAGITPPAKAPGQDPPPLGNAGGAGSAKADPTLTSAAVAGVETKGQQPGARSGQDEKLGPDGKPALKPDLAAGGFGGAMAAKPEIVRKDVYLPSADKPEQRANALLAEVGTGIALHAHKGGGEMQLVIHPGDMGEVKLKVGTRNGKVEVQISAQNDEVARMIRGGSKELEASLKEQNLSLAKFEVSVSADATSVVATDTRSGLAEQSFSQNQHPSHGGAGFAQGNLSDDGHGPRWGNDQGARQGGTYSKRSEDGGGGPRGGPALPPAASRARDGQRRLDVVA